MGSFTKTVNGLIYRDDFSDISTWTGPGISKFSSVNDLTFISFGFSPYIIFPKRGKVEGQLLRQGSIFIDSDGTWYMFFDGLMVWSTNIGSVTYTNPAYMMSKDRGLSWVYMGAIGPGDDNGAGGHTVHGYAMGFVQKYAGTYYFYRVLLDGTAGGPPYGGDVWSASSLSGTWTYQSYLTKTPATITSTENLPGSIIKVGTTYYLFIQCNNGSGYILAKMTSSSPGGTWTLDSEVIFQSGFVSSPFSESPENEKVFSYNGKYVMLFNSYYSTRATSNYVAVSSSVSSWSGKTWRRFVKECPLDNYDTLGNGVPTHYYGPDDQVIIGSNGFIPVMYDGDGGQNTPTRTDYAWMRKLKTCFLEPSQYALQYTGNDSGIFYHIFKSQSNSDFIAEFAVEFLTIVASTDMCFWFRSDGTGNNGYLLVFRNNAATPLLYKYVGGVQTLIATGSGTQTIANKMPSRCKVVASGTSIKVYLDGEKQIDITDSAFSTGTYIGAAGLGTVNAQMRLLSIRASDTITITGLQPGINVILRGDGKVPIAQGYADSNGQIQFTNNHWPLETIEIEGDGDNIPSGGIWGGDTIQFSGFSSTPVLQNIIKQK